MSSPNRVILLTPPGPAAIAVIRLAGPGVDAFLAKHFSKRATPGRCVHGELRDEAGNVLDDPVVVVDSEDPTLTDVNVHGGAWVVQSVLNLAKRAGFELFAEVPHPGDSDSVAGQLSIAGWHGHVFMPVGEHPKADPRAIVLARATQQTACVRLLEREVLASLPFARTELALRVLLAQASAWGRFKSAPESKDPQALRQIAADRSLFHLLNPPRVAIVGAPNVGKSTLANQLFAQERSITADLPGTTRDWVGEIANIDGLAVMLLDTPGVRETADPIERESIQRSGVQIARADLIVLVIDARRPIEDLALDAFNGGPAKVLRVMNKIDLATAPPPPALEALSTVGTTGQGVDDLRSAIRDHFGCLRVDPSTPHAWTQRQRDILSRATDDPRALEEL